MTRLEIDHIVESKSDELVDACKSCGVEVLILYAFPDGCHGTRHLIMEPPRLDVYAKRLKTELGLL